MTTTLNAATAGAGGLISTADASGVLQLQTAGTAALTIDGSQNVTLAGNITLNNGAADGAQVTLSSSGYSDWNIDNYSGRFRAYYGATEYFTINASGNVGIGTSSPGNYRLYVEQAGTSVDQGIAVGASANDSMLRLFHTGSVAGLAPSYDTTGSYVPLVFYSGGQERARIDTSGYLFVNTTTKVGIGGANRANFYDASNNVVSSLAGASGAAAFQGSVASTSGYLAYWAYYNGSTYTNTGSITTNGTVTAYNVSSDYRLKENITPLTGALAKIASLKPSVYNYKADPETQIEGFIAHELQEVVPHAVTGEKDAVDSEGNPVYQGVDASFLIPHLVASIQEMKTIIDQQAERIAALENK